MADVSVYRADSRLASSQWETSLQSNAVSHWLDTNLESALRVCFRFSGVVWFVIIPSHNKVVGGILVSLSPSVYSSVRPSVRLSRVLPASHVRSVAPTVLVGAISYLYILPSNFRRCVALKFLAKFQILAFFFKFVTLTLSCFDLGSDVNH